VQLLSCRCGYLRNIEKVDLKFAWENDCGCLGEGAAVEEESRFYIAFQTPSDRGGASGKTAEAQRLS
jgi:hypothetical protein